MLTALLLLFVAHVTQAGEENETQIVIQGIQQADNFTEETFPIGKKVSLSPERKVQQWLIQQRDEHSGWRSETHRAIIALALFDPHYFFHQDSEARLSLKQLDLQLALALAKQQEEHFSQGQLALYINALLAVCRNPRDFYGINLVAKLYRPRNISAESASFNSKYEFALVSLTLCNAGVHLRNSHLLELIDMLPDDARRRGTENDHKFLAVLALQCATRSARLSYLKRYLDRAIEKLRRMQDLENGGFGNLYTSAIITQALIEAGDDIEWNKKAALLFLSHHQRPDGSFGDLLATYLALPPLIGQSLVSISRMDCKKKHATFLEHEDSYGEEIERNRTTAVTISVWMPQTNFSTVVFAPKNATLYDVIKGDCSGYRFHIKTYSWGHYITGINNLEENVKEQLHWVVSKYDSDHTIAPIQMGINNIYIEESEHYVFIYKK